jgi:hypothetical protein
MKLTTTSKGEYKMRCRLDRRSEDYNKCGNCPYLSCPCNKVYLDKAVAMRKKKLVGKVVVGFTTEAFYIGILLGIEVSDRNGKVKFKIRDEKNSRTRRCNSVYYRKEK